MNIPLKCKATPREEKAINHTPRNFSSPKNKSPFMQKPRCLCLNNTSVGNLQYVPGAKGKRDQMRGGTALHSIETDRAQEQSNSLIL
jgi:hypothetical protein